MRIDPGKGVALMSLPRDLKVEIPGHGTDKINVAYTLGGPKLTIKTVKKLTGLAINHYVDVSFHGFAEGVNALGCVYVDVDRRYFNDNAGLGFGQNYAVINVKPGYQKMCGQRALEYVRYRHTDNDIVRGARQQDFLRQVRSQVTPRKLLGKTGKLIDIFADNTRSDIQSTGALRRLLRSMLGVADKPIKQVKFHGRLGESYVTALAAQIKAAVAPVPVPAPGEGPAEPEQRKRSKTPARASAEPPRCNLVDFTVTSRGAGPDREGPRRLPRLLPAQARAGVLVRRGRAAHLHDHGARRQALPRLQDGGLHRLHRRVLRRAGHLAGATRRSSSTPSETRTIRGREYLLFYNGDRLRLVGWKTEQGVVLDLEHAAADALREGDAGRRALADQRAIVRLPRRGR